MTKNDAAEKGEWKEGDPIPDYDIAFGVPSFEFVRFLGAVHKQPCPVCADERRSWRLIGPPSESVYAMPAMKTVQDDEGVFSIYDASRPTTFEPTANISCGNCGMVIAFSVLQIHTWLRRHPKGDK